MHLGVTWTLKLNEMCDCNLHDGTFINHRNALKVLEKR